MTSYEDKMKARKRVDDFIDTLLLGVNQGMQTRLRLEAKDLLDNLESQVGRVAARSD